MPSLRIARMFAVIEASVNIERVIIFVIEGHLAEELYVLCGNGLFYLAARVVKVFFRLEVQRSLCVLLKSLVAARHVREPEARIVAVNEPRAMVERRIVCIRAGI